MLVQRLEHAKIGECPPAILLKSAKALAKPAPRGPVIAQIERLETAPQRLHDRPLAGSDRAVVDQLGRARGPSRGAEPVALDQTLRGRVLGKARGGRGVDVKIIEPGPARRRIGAEMQRLGRKPRVQRVDAQDRGAIISSLEGERGEIGKVAHSPIVFAAQPVELTGQPPAARPGSELWRQIAAGGGHDQVELCRDAAGLERQPMIAGRQSRRQRNGGPPALGRGVDRHPAGALAAVFEAAGPGDLAGSGRRAQRERGRGLFSVDETGRAEPQGCRSLALLQFGCRLRRVGRQAESADQRQQAFVRGLAGLGRARRCNAFRCRRVRLGGPARHGRSSQGAAGGSRKKLALTGAPAAAVE